MNKEQYYIVRWPRSNGDKVLDIVAIDNSSYYIHGSDEPYDMNELEILAGPFTMEEIANKLGVISG